MFFIDVKVIYFWSILQIWISYILCNKSKDKNQDEGYLVEKVNFIGFGIMEFCLKYKSVIQRRILSVKYVIYVFSIGIFIVFCFFEVIFQEFYINFLVIDREGLKCLFQKDRS